MVPCGAQTAFNASSPCHISMVLSKAEIHFKLVFKDNHLDNVLKVSQLENLKFVPHDAQPPFHFWVLVCCLFFFVLIRYRSRNIKYTV